MGMVFKPREGSRMTEEQAARYGPRLMQLEKKNQGLVAADVVKDAENPRSVLHDYFIWDDKEAAGEYRLWQARKMIGSVMITVDRDGEQEQTRAFHPVVIQGARTYASMSTVIDNENLRAQVVQNALSELTNWKKRYAQYAELFGVVQAIEEATNKVGAEAK